MPKSKLDYQRENRKLREQLRDLTASVQWFCARMDHLMGTEHSTVARGKKIAALMNDLQMSGDAALHFGLKYSLKRVEQVKKLTRAAAEKEKD